MEKDEFTIGENFKLKIYIIKTSDHREYLNIFIKNSSTNEEYNSNFDFDFLKTAARVLRVSPRKTSDGFTG